MLIESILTVAGVHLISVASPGPDFAVVTKNSLQNGRTNGIATAFGIVAANLIYVLITLSGLSMVVRTSPTLLTMIKFMGVTFLLYLSYKCIQSNGISEQAIEKESNGKSRANGFVSGFMTSALNPKAIFYFTSILSQFVQPNSSLMNRSIYGAVVVSISGLWFLSVVHLISWERFRSFFYRASKWIDKGMAVILFGFAISMLFA